MVTTPRPKHEPARLAHPADPANRQAAQAAQQALARVQHSDDIIDYTLACVLAMAPELSQALLQQASAQVRDTFGGDRVYVSRRSGDGKSARNAQIRRDYLAGDRIPLLQRRYGLSAPRIWQIINEQAATRSV